MKEFAWGIPRAFFDLRVIVGIIGIVLSIATHELFHILIHLGEIDTITIFPDSHAIVEIIFTPNRQYNLAVEEGIAYAITMITLILTAMLISDISDARAERTPSHGGVLDRDFKGYYAAGNERQAYAQLSDLLGIQS